ncbi:hypothetical protein BGZ70_000915 [Mortierella alpina]|uniref:Uncharacterized protein n=1 Tax=Mortierella alpina TaxID=64518 RepID=A0A9P6JFD1_MORAP|nr:hypothetical protein BGZ70_000915 [Mortierella alpina]
MVASSSVPNSGPSIDWADDTDEEIDFAAPVFSDDEELAATLASNASSSTADYAEAGDEDRREHAPAARYTAGFADGSNHSLDRRSQNHSTVQPQSNRTRTNLAQPPYRDSPNHRQDRHLNGQSSSSGKGSSRSFERENHWRSDARRDQGSGGSSSFGHAHGSPHADSDNLRSRRNDSRGGGPRSARQVIPLPPKPRGAADATSRQQFDRSRSPSYRAHSPQPDIDRPWEHSRQFGSSPQSHSGRSLSPTHAPHHSGMSTRSSNHSRPPRTYTDQVAQANERPRRHSRDQASEGRWEKTPHEDKPYPVNHPPVHSGSPSNDTIYFKRRDGRPMEADSRVRSSSGTMYHEQVEANNARPRGPSSHAATNDRWEKTVLTEPDLPYPEKPIILVTSGSKVHQKDTKARAHNQPEATPEKFSSSPRGNRGKGKDQNKRKSKDRPIYSVEEKDQHDDGAPSENRWWEQSTYGPGGKAKKDESTVESGKGAASESDSSKTAPSAKETAKAPAKSKDVPKPTAEAANAAGEVPWWEQSTYKVKPKTATGESASQQASTPTKSETMARREALGKKTLTTGIEDLTLVSRGGDDSGSSHSLKSRSVQERVFSEIKAMISKYEDQYGKDKLAPLPARTRQSDEMDRILESFLYEQSILCSLYAGNIPELTKALHYLIQEIYPAAHKAQHNHPSHGPSQATVVVPLKSQRFLGLYILHHIAKPTRSVAPTTDSMDSFSQVILYPRTETDQWIASLLHEYERQQLQPPPERSLHTSDKKADIQEPSSLGPELMFALAYWKTLRTNNWIQRERLLCPKAAETAPVSWDQRLMIRHSMGDALGTARGQTVAAMSKAYYSLPISAMAEAVGLAPPRQGAQMAKAEEGTGTLWVKKLQSSYGLLPTIIIRDEQLMFKAKS